jgi:hypothetical protein
VVSELLESKGQMILGIGRASGVSALFSLWLVLLIAILGAKLFLPEIYGRYLEQEDAFSEYLQALNYLVAAFLSMFFSLVAKRNGLTFLGSLYLFLGLGLAFVSFEEISWGQRLFGISTPEYFGENNVQGELTVHNLTAFQPLLRHVYIAISAYGAFAWILLPLLSSVFKVGCRHFLNYVIADWFLAPYFLMCFLIYAWLHYLRPYMYLNEIGSFSDDFWFFVHWRDEEHAELFLSFGFLFFVMAQFDKLRRCLAKGTESVISR